MTGTNTPRLALYKPNAVGENVSITNLNNNMTALDNAVDRICTSGTRPVSPYVGMRIYETDTKKTLTHDGSAWNSEVDNAEVWPKMYFDIYSSAGASIAGGTTLTTNTVESLPVETIAYCVAEGIAGFKTSASEVGLDAAVTGLAGAVIVKRYNAERPTAEISKFITVTLSFKVTIPAGVSGTIITKSLVNGYYRVGCVVTRMPS